MFYENLIALNPLNRDPNLRGEVPLAIEVQEVDPGAMTAGVVTVDAVSKFGLNKGEVWGAYLLNNIGGANEIIGVSAAAHASTTGSITITFNSSSSSSIINLGSTKVFVVGKIIPSNPS